jgi:hypothetical protein
VVAQRSEPALRDPCFDRAQEVRELEPAAEGDFDLPAILVVHGRHHAAGAEPVTEALRNVASGQLDEDLVEFESLACHAASVADAHGLSPEPIASFAQAQAKSSAAKRKNGERPDETDCEQHGDERKRSERRRNVR